MSVLMPAGLFGDVASVTKFCRRNIRSGLERNVRVDWGPLRAHAAGELVACGAVAIRPAERMWRPGIAIATFASVAEGHIGCLIDMPIVFRAYGNNVWCALALAGRDRTRLLSALEMPDLHLTLLSRFLAPIDTLGDVFVDRKGAPRSFLDALDESLGLRCMELGASAEDLTHWKSPEDVRRTIRALLQANPKSVYPDEPPADFDYERDVLGRAAPTAPVDVRELPLLLPEGLFGDAPTVKRFCKERIVQGLARSGTISWGPLRAVRSNEVVMYDVPRRSYPKLAVWRVGLAMTHLLTAFDRGVGKRDAASILQTECDNVWCAIGLFGQSGRSVMYIHSDRRTRLAMVERHLASLARVGDIFSEYEDRPGPLVVATYGNLAADCHQMGVTKDEIQAWKTVGDIHTSIRRVLGL